MALKRRPSTAEAERQQQEIMHRKVRNKFGFGVNPTRAREIIRKRGAYVGGKWVSLGR